MAKKKGSILGSILKDTVDITGEIIKTGYEAATSKTAKKFYKGTADLTKDAIKGTYDAVTSESAKKIYKKTGETAVDMMRFTPPKEKLTKLKLVKYLTKEEEQIKDTYKAFWQDHLKKDYDNKSYSKFRSHWRAICAQMVFGGLAKTHSSASYIEMREYLREELDKKDSEIMRLVVHLYSKAYANGGLEVSRILNTHCFNDELSEKAIDELNSGLAIMHKMIVEGLK